MPKSKKLNMFTEPFKILKEKIPFIEYSIRGIQLIFKPVIENQEQLHSGNMKFALWDVFLSISLFTTIIGLLSILEPNSDLNSILSVFSSQFTLLFEFGYIAYFSTFVFFILMLVFMSIFRTNDNDPLKGAFLVSLHYARFYALFLFCFLPFLLVYMQSLFTELMTIEEFTNKYLFESLLVAFFIALLYVRCCVIPIKRFWEPVNSSIWSYLIVVFATYLAFSANSFAPNLGALELNKERACALFLKSNKVKGLNSDQQRNFQIQCLR